MVDEDVEELSSLKGCIISRVTTGKDHLGYTFLRLEVTDGRVLEAKEQGQCGYFTVEIE